MSPSLVLVGASQGGLEALQVVLGGLPRGFRPPVVIVQHQLPGSSEGLGQVLQASSRLPVRTPNDKEALAGGHVYVAPADYHLLVERGHLALSTDPPVHFARPSIDVLFESAAISHGEGVVAVVLTGSNEDGAAGARLVEQHGGVVVVQDPASAAARAMPDAALGATAVDYVLPLGEIGPLLVRLCGSTEESEQHD